MLGLGRRSRSTSLAVLAASLLALPAAALLVSCIIAEPEAELPKLPPFRPTILHGSVSPPASRILVSFPDKFVIPVELVDPSAEFLWRAFVDYNPLTGDGIVDTGQSLFDRAGTDGGVRVLEVTLPAPDLTRCHTIEFIVANNFRGDIEGRQAHTPDSTGGDSVTWFYVPAGDFAACSSPDAGGPPDAGDAATDALEGGVR
jgi:hypothetical protein